MNRQNLSISAIRSTDILTTSASVDTPKSAAAPCNAFLNASADWNRLAGSFSMAIRIMLLTAAGKSGRSSIEIGRGV